MHDTTENRPERNGGGLTEMQAFGYFLPCRFSAFMPFYLHFYFLNQVALLFVLKKKNHKKLQQRQ